MLRTHTCRELRQEHIGQTVTLAGWVATIRDHGGVMFVDLRDHYGVTQIVLHDNALLAGVNKECTVSITGTVKQRDADTVNDKLETGNVEVHAETLTVLGAAKNMLPFEIENSREVKEDTRLKYRFLDLRNPVMHEKLIFRSKVIGFLRSEMERLGFLEIQTPILTASSPEGARDYLVPSRRHAGKFYALPQAPQQFKQLLMVSGFDKYFQIAPCFRDEDARQDRLPGEFYQLDFEMSFAEQEDVFNVAQEVIINTFKKFTEAPVSTAPFRRIPYAEALLKYGTDKPDLRNPLEIIDLSEFFADAGFAAFKGKPVRGIVANTKGQPKSFFEKMLAFALSIGMKGLGYLTRTDGAYKGPIEKFLSAEKQTWLTETYNISDGDTVFFISDTVTLANKYAGQIRVKLGETLGLIDEGRFELCFIVDFPMYEINDETGKPDFMHNPFSMPQGNITPDVLAFQYDTVCNGYEISSGAVRNHDPEVMKRAFEFAGYNEDDIKDKFAALYTAFQYGAPPHAGMAYGIERLLMLISNSENIREVVAFPLNGDGRDPLLGAPSEVTELQLRETHIRLR
ncbi:MAG: aspartate--tRNA ligase [Oscillospiraceae bacterium]|jgi:aspartyl-tRNA synthetase|nr:aspartate--tRNA ligase [Oscillospiraceae bacterium]